MVATIHLRRAVSDDEIERISGDNPGWQVERNGDGSLVVSPNATEYSPKNAELTAQLVAYAKRAGGKAFGPDAGFTMPNGALLSPDGAWVAAERWAALLPRDRMKYARIVPDVCVELVSPSDRKLRVRRKVENYRRFGAGYAVYIDPDERASWAVGEPPEGFALDLDAIYDA